MPVGLGVKHRQYIPPGPEKPPVDPEVNFDPKKEEWVDKPSIVGQLGDQRLWKMDRVETKIFDLSNPEQLAEYNILCSKAVLPDTNFGLSVNDRQFCQQTGSWKVLVEIQYVKFRKLLVKDEQTSRD